MTTITSQRGFRSRRLQVRREGDKMGSHRTDQDRAAHSTLSLIVKRELADQARQRAQARGLSMNQYLKVLVLYDLGHTLPPGQTIQEWVRGK